MLFESALSHLIFPKLVFLIQFLLALGFLIVRERVTQASASLSPSIIYYVWSRVGRDTSWCSNVYTAHRSRVGPGTSWHSNVNAARISRVGPGTSWHSNVNAARISRVGPSTSWHSNVNTAHRSRVGPGTSWYSNVNTAHRSRVGPGTSWYSNVNTAHRSRVGPVTSWYGNQIHNGMQFATGQRDGRGIAVNAIHHCSQTDFQQYSLNEKCIMHETDKVMWNFTDI